MSLDKVTEMVSHMIGIFHTTLEEERMRDVYDKFTALIAQDPEMEAPGTVGFQFKAKHTLDGFSPDINYAGSPFNGATTPIGTPLIQKIYFSYSGVLPAFASHHATDLPQAAQEAGAEPMQLTLEPPSSVVVVTYQTAFLSDNDVLFTDGSDTVFIDPAVYLAELQQSVLVASALELPTDIDRLTPGEAATEDAISIWQQIGSVEASTFTGVTSTALHGVDATGLHLNGTLVEELPTLDDLLPSFMSDDSAEIETEADVEDDSVVSVVVSEADTSAEEGGLGTANEGTPDHEFPNPFEGLDGGYSDGIQPEIESGHAVVAGANALINQASITTAWLDAPVISVAGDVVNLDVVSQVNFLSDHDIGSLGEISASVTANSSNMTFTSSLPTPEDAPEGEGETNDLGLPSNWAVTRIEGDLLCVNQISQYTFQTDNDIAEISFGSTNTYIGLGDNTIINLTDLGELGYGYDLIMIGGSLISVNWISQCNVLIDNDTMTYSGLAPTSLDGGDNLLFNGAVINEVGIDGYADMQSNFANAADDFEAGATNIDTSVAHDSLFEGIDILRVLYIEGDFTTINWLDQTNILGDSDQINLMMDEFLANTDGEVNVTAGSNALINVASINEFGVDSTVMVGGEVYDDALLYTADLIDTEADPLGVNLPALASEAVVFLADDMMEVDAGAADAPIMATAPESTASPDVMQTMLA